MKDGWFIGSNPPTQREGITTLRIYKYWIFHHTVIETSFEMLKSSEHEKFWRYSIQTINPHYYRLPWSWSPKVISLINSEKRGPCHPLSYFHLGYIAQRNSVTCLFLILILYYEKKGKINIFVNIDIWVLSVILDHYWKSILIFV